MHRFAPALAVLAILAILAADAVATEVRIAPRRPAPHGPPSFRILGRPAPRMVRPAPIRRPAAGGCVGGVCR